MYDRLILVFFLLPVSFAYGQIDTNLGDDLFVFVQTIVRDTDGNLVTYMESSTFTDLNRPVLQEFLDLEAKRGYDSLTINGQDHQVIRRAQSQTFESYEMISSTLLSDSMDGRFVTIARFAHDGYLTVPGDTLTSIWTFIRQI